MAALVAKPSVLPGLNTALGIQDFRTSGALYNTHLDDSDQPRIADKCITDLAEILVRHNAEKVLGIHLIHGHFKIPKSTVILGTNFEGPSLRWTKVTDIDKIDPPCVHGHIFALTKDGLCAYELQDGPLPDLSGVGPRFLDEFIDNIVKNDLTSLIGLQVLGCSDDSISELILDQGTVMLESAYVKTTVPTRITSWKFEATDGRPRVCSANKTHTVIISGNHKVFNAGKPLPKLKNIDDLKTALAVKEWLHYWFPRMWPLSDQNDVLPLASSEPATGADSSPVTLASLNRRVEQLKALSLVGSVETLDPPVPSGSGGTRAVQHDG